MKYRKLGKTGLFLSEIGFGSWATLGENLTNKQSLDLLSAAHDFGINYFDTAETYADGETEKALGSVLNLLSWPREKFVISAKVFWGIHKRFPNSWGLSRKHIFEGCHASLKRLKLSHLDLYLCHRYDAESTIEEVVTAMHDLIKQGKVLYWGTSEWPANKFMQAYQFAKANNLYAPVLEQLEYNLFKYKKVETEFLNVYTTAGIGLTTWSPLKSGLLAGKYVNSIPEKSRLETQEWLAQELFGDQPELRKYIITKIQKLLNTELGITLKEFCLRWCLRNNNVTSIITSASQLSHLEEAVAVSNNSLDISPEIFKKVNQILDLKEIGTCV